LEFITTGSGRAEETRKLSPLQGLVRQSASAGWNRSGSWTPVSIFRANLDGEVERLFAGQIYGIIPEPCRTATQLVEAPNAKFQAPEKHQATNIKYQSARPAVWSLEFGISLVLGAWDLELSRP
jgi:hypothetical protein